MERYTVRNTFLDEMKKAFRHFDKDHNGYISPDELRKALLRMKIRDQNYKNFVALTGRLGAVNCRKIFNRDLRQLICFYLDKFTLER